MLDQKVEIKELVEIITREVLAALSEDKVTKTPS